MLPDKFICVGVERSSTEIAIKFYSRFNLTALGVKLATTLPW